jgi:hypothetical protein
MAATDRTSSPEDPDSSYVGRGTPAKNAVSTTELPTMSIHLGVSGGDGLTGMAAEETETATLRNATSTSTERYK